MTADNILSLLLNPDCDAEMVSAVPLVIKFLAERDEGIQILRKMKVVMFGGSALSAETGDKLVAEGVRLVGQLGTSKPCPRVDLQCFSTLLAVDSRNRPGTPMVYH
jgi:hypothetical protein